MPEAGSGPGPHPSGIGADRPTLKDVAARAGVSRALASMVIRDVAGPSAASRARVLQAIDELGYRPDPAAQLLRRHRSRLLGVVFAVHDTFHADLVEYIYPAAERHQYEVVLGAVVPSRAAVQAIDALLSSRCEALITLGSTAGPDLLADLAGRLPVVTVGQPAKGVAVDAIRTAEGEGVIQAVDHLVALGHRRIVHVDGGRKAGAAERRSGYRSAMRRHRLADQIRVIRGDHTEAAGGRAARTLLRENDLPTAILASNDRCAMGILDAFGRAGVRVPQDVSVVGYDDSQLSRLTHINLTTVRQDTARIAELAVSAVAERLDNGRIESTDALLSPQLIVRETTGPVRR
jgi:DNA-binding LacI/PurR family transcriptional regulator